MQSAHKLENLTWIWCRIICTLGLLMFKTIHVGAEPFTFGGNNQLLGAGVDHSLRDQEVLIGVMRPKWATNTGGFATFEPQVTTAFDRMNSFWDEASFGKV